MSGKALVSNTTFASGQNALMAAVPARSHVPVRLAHWNEAQTEDHDQVVQETLLKSP